MLQICSAWGYAGSPGQAVEHCSWGSGVGSWCPARHWCAAAVAVGRWKDREGGNLGALSLRQSQAGCLCTAVWLEMLWVGVEEKRPRSPSSAARPPYPRPRSSILQPSRWLPEEEPWIPCPTAAACPPPATRLQRAAGLGCG